MTRCSIPTAAACATSGAMWRTSTRQARRHLLIGRRRRCARSVRPAPPHPASTDRAPPPWLRHRIRKVLILTCPNGPTSATRRVRYLDRTTAMIVVCSCAGQQSTSLVERASSSPRCAAIQRVARSSRS
eukprot:scaffold39174_cov26-Tisochrysis_lutea.AAC.3